jgi:regulator of sigma E protease
MLGEEDPTAPGSFASKPRWIRAVVLAAGSGMNFLLAVLAFSMVYIVGVPGVPLDGPVQLAEVVADSPAATAGLQAGDVILSFDGQPVNVQSFRQATQSHLDQQIQIEARRGSQTMTVTLTPRANPPQGQGAIGIVLAGGLVRLSPVEAVSQGVLQTVHIIGATLSVPKMLLEGTVAPGDARLIGLVGMAQTTSEAVSYVADTGFWYPLFVLTGVFSAGLSIAKCCPSPRWTAVVCSSCFWNGSAAGASRPSAKLLTTSSASWCC